MVRGVFSDRAVCHPLGTSVTFITIKQEQTLFKDLQQQDIEIKNDETKY